MDTIVTGFLLGLGLIGALMFVANIGWVVIGACCLAALALVALFPGFVACIVILIVGGLIAPPIILRLKQQMNELKTAQFPSTPPAAPRTAKTSGQPQADPGPRPHRRQNASRLDHLWLAAAVFILVFGCIIIAMTPSFEPAQSAPTHPHIPSSPPLVMPCFCFSPWLEF